MIDDCINKHKNTLFFTVVYKMIAFFQYCALINFNWTNVGPNRPCSVCPIRNVCLRETNCNNDDVQYLFFHPECRVRKKSIYTVLCDRTNRKKNYIGLQSPNRDEALFHVKAI